LLLDCIKLNAIKVPDVGVKEICGKCELLIQRVTEPGRTIPYAGLIFVTAASNQADNHIGNVIERVFNPKQGIRQSSRVRAGPAMSAIQEAQSSTDDEYYSPVSESEDVGIAHLIRPSKPSGAAASALSSQGKGKSKKGGKTRKPILRTRRRHKTQIQVKFARNTKQTRNLKVKTKRRYTRRGGA
jgi:hypothetical protein